MTSHYDKGYEKAAHLYDIFDNKDNINFFLHFASEAAEIIDIGAGTGRIAIPLAQKGITVFCVEPSPAMRREFVRKLSARPHLSKNIRIMEGDAMSFDFGRTFPAAFLSATFDHFLDDDERIASLTNIARHLQPQGRLIFDVFLGLMKNSSLSPAGEYKEGNKEYRRFVGGKLIPGNRKETILIFETFESGTLIERIEERSLVGIIDRENLHKLLKKTGFEVQQELSNYDRTAFKRDDKLLIIEAMKK
ncbi:MAG: class I SAM-dependent methyltransferase [candidate division WOR-3 bacterium]|nr:MAG: class I SAM-dependent methyltransferase [candidate division WOR-3 bacterium]